MSNNFNMTALFLIFVAILTNHGHCEDKMPIELKLSVFPETVAIGDTCYVLVTAINHSDEDAGVLAPGFEYTSAPDMVQFDLSRHGKTWRGTFECWLYMEGDRLYLGSFLIPSGKSVTFLAVSLQFPPLEDLYGDAFWKETLLELKDHPEGLAFEFGIEFARPYAIQESDRGMRARLTKDVTIKLRDEKEMTMIDQWYRNTPREFFPKIMEGKYILKVPSLSYSDGPTGKLKDGFQILSNRYPGAPNRPATWQGWKELEESITPSTMRDEIRLMRMLIQYRDTKDAKVLEELKEWFAGMNEIQRTCMAQSIRDRTSGSSGTELLAPYRDLYKTIREYDLAAKSKRESERLKTLKLLE